MKKIRILATCVACLALALCLAGCQQEQKSTDEAFVEAVSQGLQDRWAITDETNATDSDYSTKLDQGIEKERAAVSEYKDAEFENSELGEYAKSYIDALENLKASDAVSSTGYNTWQQYYIQRVSALYGINGISEIKVPEDYQSNLDEVLSDGERAKAALSLIDGMVFEAQEPEYEGATWLTYKAVVENTSDVNFTYFAVNVSLEDADGVVVETATAYTQDWAPGTKHTFEFYTDAEFVKSEVTSCQWS